MHDDMLKRVLAIIMDGEHKFSYPESHDDFTRLVIPKDYLPAIADALGFTPGASATPVNGVLVFDAGGNYLFSTKDRNRLAALLARIREAEHKATDPPRKAEEVVRQKVGLNTTLPPDSFGCHRDAEGRLLLKVAASRVRADKNWKPEGVERIDKGNLVIFAGKSPETVAAAAIFAVNAYQVDLK